MKFLIICLVAIASVAADNNDYYATANVRSDIREDGAYSYAYDTSNGISAQESGVGGVKAQGSAKWTAPDGTPVEFTYVADENGYRAEGPFVPATPPHVLRLIEYLRTHAPHEDTQYYRQAPPQPSVVRSQVQPVRPVRPAVQPAAPFKPFVPFQQKKQFQGFQGFQGNRRF